MVLLDLLASAGDVGFRWFVRLWLKNSPTRLQGRPNGAIRMTLRALLRAKPLKMQPLGSFLEARALKMEPLGVT